MSGMKIKKNDMVKVRTGKFKGKVGKVIQAFPKQNTVLVEGVNIVKKHKKARKQGDEGGIVEVTKPMTISKVVLVDPKTNEPTRVTYKVLKNNKKVRVSKKSGEEI